MIAKARIENCLSTSISARHAERTAQTVGEIGGRLLFLWLVFYVKRIGILLAALFGAACGELTTTLEVTRICGTSQPHTAGA